MTKKKELIQLHILMGLPGSGKTTFAKEKAHENCSRTHVINGDNAYKTVTSYYAYQNKDKHNSLLYLLLNDLCCAIDRKQDIIYLDGLFLTNQDILDVLKYFSSSCQMKVTIHYWNPDRETCLKNDGGRREVSSALTILNAHIEKPNIDWLKDNTDETAVLDIKVKNHQVFLKPDWMRYLRPFVNVENGLLVGCSWSEGGTCGSCYSDGLSYIEAESPREFEEFDSLLSEICPNLTFLQYKKLCKICTNTQTRTHRDYYGGTTTERYWVCDLQKMYEALVEMGVPMINHEAHINQ